MKNFPAILSGLVISAGMVLPSAHCVAQPVKGPAAVTNAPAPEAEIPLSVFVLPATQREGRNPFFPNSSLFAPVAKVQVATADYSNALVINGITPLGRRRTVMINGKTLEQGEQAEVPIPGGKLLLKCEEIKEDSAIVSYNGLRRELHLRSGL